MSKLTDSKDYKIGIHSNIPECCVMFFTEIASYSDDIIILINGYRNIDRLYELGPGYVMCPLCYDKWINKELEPNKLHICNNLCEKFS